MIKKHNALFVRFYLLLGFAMILFCGKCQKTYQFKEGLVAFTGHQYGREAVYEDQLAFRLYSQKLTPPSNGALYGKDSEGHDIYWQSIKADSSNHFNLSRFTEDSRERRGAYIYFSYTSDRDQNVLLHVKGNAGLFFNGVPHAGDPYAAGWLYIPIQLKKGLNEFYIRPSYSLEACLVFTEKAAQINVEDPTVPVLIASDLGNDSLNAAVVVINNSNRPLRGYTIRATVGQHSIISKVSEIIPMSSRKIPFIFNASTMIAKGKYSCLLTLMDHNRIIDEKTLEIEAVAKGESYSITFKSKIDGSLQYYAVTPKLSDKTHDISPSTEGFSKEGKEAPPGTVFAQGAIRNQKFNYAQIDTTHSSALYLSVHGAGVEAIGQARAYEPKDWGTLVAPTNRRPRGFNWEDWGRIDALEVLELAKEKFHPEPGHIYLTGHSMGGHGTWFLGVTYPDKWAAIGACSGYPTLKDYGSHDGIVPDTAQSPVEQMLLRASDQSDVIKMATNYKALGVYILHGDSDKVVPVKYARQMRKVFADFQTDMSYYEYPGGEHWYGNQCVDWHPLFNYFRWHERKQDSLVNHIDYITSSPGISSSCYWAVIEQQDHPLAYSHIQLDRNPKTETIQGITDNVSLLTLSMSEVPAGTQLEITLDGQAAIPYISKGKDDSLYLRKRQNIWSIITKPSDQEKGPQRYGTFKDAFNHNMLFVYGTVGTAEENAWSIEKARYDAETWYYRGNGAVDIISDKEYAIGKYKDRGVILYGNANTNYAYDLLLKNCPIQVARNSIKIGEKEWTGDDLSTYFVWPLHNSPIASVAVVGGTGLKGMAAANANQYFAGASGFPDFMVFNLDMLQTGSHGIKAAGFFDNEWHLSKNEMVENN